MFLRMKQSVSLLETECFANIHIQFPGQYDVKDYNIIYHHHA